MPGLLLAVQLCIHHAKKKKKKLRSPYWDGYQITFCGMDIKLPFVALQCIFLLCVAAANCSLLFLESLVPFLILPYYRIVNLELIKFAKLLPLHWAANWAANCLRVLFAHQLDYIFVVYCINTTQLVMRWVAMSQHP